MTLAELTREIIETANRQSRRLRELLHAPKILVMPGAYDVLSARLFEAMGFPAIQGSSGAIAALHGLYDEDLMGLERTAESYRAIVQAVTVPVNADGEKGYGGPDDMIRTVTELVRVGLAGMNIEDSAPHAHGAPTTLVPLDEQLAKLNAIAAAKHTLGSEFFINARVDVFGTVSSHQEGMDEAVRRGNAYAEAGADCIFIFRPGDAATIGTLAREMHAPLSVLANETTPAIPELEQLGVARVSYGSSFGRLAISAVRDLAEVLAARGDPAPLLRGGMQRAELQGLLRGE
jgi:2-methylisocitrate lyase-like PEP mutase family enzyme